MKKLVQKIIFITILFSMAVNLVGCAGLVKKFIRKPKKKTKKEVFSKGRTFDVKPSYKLYQKHYIFWVNWYKKFTSELGENHKSDMRSIQEMIGNLEDMSGLLVDEKGQLLDLHIAEVKKAESILAKRAMTKVNETRVQRITKKEFKNIQREFSPKRMSGFIKAEWK